MRKLIIVVILLSYGSFAQAKDSENIYVNGAFSSPSNIADDITGLELKLGNVSVTSSPNSSEGVLADIYEAIFLAGGFNQYLKSPVENALESVGLEGETLSYQIAAAENIFNVVRTARTVGAAGLGNTEYATDQDLIDASLYLMDKAKIHDKDGSVDSNEVILDILESPVTALIYALQNIAHFESSEAGSESGLLSSTINGHIAQDKGVNIIAYGSGNGIVTEALSGVNSANLENVRALGISTTTNTYGERLSSKYVNLFEDIPLGGANIALPGPGLPWISNYTNDEINQLLNGWPYDILALFLPTTIYGLNENLYGEGNVIGEFDSRGFGHSLTGVYLKDFSDSRDDTSLEAIRTAFSENSQEIQNIPSDICPECYQGGELPFPGNFIGIWEPNDPSPDHYSGGGYSKNYTLDVSSNHGSSCREVEITVTSEVDSYIDVRVGNTRIGYDDNGGVGTNARYVAEMNLGSYDVEVTGKSLYEDNPDLNKFNLTVSDLGPCVTVTDNVYLGATTVDDLESNIVVEQGQEVRLKTYQMYSGDTEGNELAAPNLTYYLSLDTNFTSNEEIGSDYSTIGSNDVSDVESMYYTIPTGTQSGTWYFGFKADSANEIIESDEDDNIKWVEVTVAGSSSGGGDGDLFITNPYVSDDNMYVGQEYRLRARHTYEGDKTSSQLGDVKMRYYISEDTVKSSDDEYLGYDYSSIGSNDSYDTESMYWTPTSSDVGLRYVLFRADASDDVDESDENNNYTWIAIVVYN